MRKFKTDKIVYSDSQYRTTSDDSKNKSSFYP